LHVCSDFDLLRAGESDRAAARSTARLIIKRAFHEAYLQLYGKTVVSAPARITSQDSDCGDEISATIDEMKRLGLPIAFGHASNSGKKQNSTDRPKVAKKKRRRRRSVERNDADVSTSSDNHHQPTAPVSFYFDAVHDDHLVAANASSTYRKDSEIAKYWYQRYRLFTRLDEGILMDRGGAVVGN
jgi:hypothetical protein